MSDVAAALEGQFEVGQEVMVISVPGWTGEGEPDLVGVPYVGVLIERDTSMSTPDWWRVTRRPGYDPNLSYDDGAWHVHAGRDIVPIAEDEDGE